MEDVQDKIHISTGCGKSLSDIKSGKMTFTSLLYARKESGYALIPSYYELHTEYSGYKALLKALSHFDSDGVQTQIYLDWEARFTNRSGIKDSTGIFDGKQDTGCKKVTSFKFFKNGKVEVYFDSQTSALAFAKKYMGYIENTDCAS